MAAQLTLTLLPESLAVCRLRGDQGIPQWALGPGSIRRFPGGIPGRWTG